MLPKTDENSGFIFLDLVYFERTQLITIANHEIALVRNFLFETPGVFADTYPQPVLVFAPNGETLYYLFSLARN